MPSVFFAMYKNDASSYVSYQYYYAQFNKPILINSADYAAGDVFKYSVRYFFVSSPVRDYTVQVYSKQTLTVHYEAADGPTNVLHTDG